MANVFQAQHVGKNFKVTDTQEHCFKVGEVVQLEVVLDKNQALLRNKVGGLYKKGFSQVLSTNQVTPL